MTPKHKYHYSKKLPLIFGAVYLLNYLTDGRLADLFVLSPALAIENLEFWRLFTYTLAPGPIEGIALFAITFFIAAPKLEEILNGNLFLALLIPLTFLQGALYSIVFWNSPVALGGLEGVSLFVLTLLAFFNPRLRIKFWIAPSIRMAYFSIFMILAWGGIKAVGIYYSPDIIMQQVFPALFGIGCGFLTNIQFRLLYRFISKKREEPDLKIPSPEELKLAMISEQKSSRYNQKNDDMDLPELDDDPDANQQRLDEILDKILENGKDSLSDEEKRFLNYYSKHL